MNIIEAISTGGDAQLRRTCNSNEVVAPSFDNMLLDSFPQNFPFSFAGLHKAKPHPWRNASIEPNGLGHYFNCFSSKKHEQEACFAQRQAFYRSFKGNEYLLDCDVPRFAIERSPVRYHRHRPPDFCARGFSFFDVAAQRPIPHGLFWSWYPIITKQPGFANIVHFY